MQFVRIKDYVFNLESLAYVRVEKTFIDFGFAFPVDAACGQNYIRLEKGSSLQEAEFEQVKDFVLQLPDPDRVIVV
jgi:hypothetical protein